MDREWLRELRIKNGLSQKFIADYLDVKQPTYCNIETGKGDPSVHLAKRLGEALNFDWPRLFEDGGRYPPDESRPQ